VRKNKHDKATTGGLKHIVLFDLENLLISAFLAHYRLTIFGELLFI